MNIDFQLRKAVRTDARAIARVNYSTWQHTYFGLIPDSELDALNVDLLTDNWLEYLDNRTERSNTYVIVNRDLVVAYSRYYPSRDPDDDPIRVATIGSMYVDPDFQMRGLGKNLMKAVHEAIEGDGFAEVTLHVLAANRRARKFYESLDWIEDPLAHMEGSPEETTQKLRYRRKYL